VLDPYDHLTDREHVLEFEQHRRHLFSLGGLEPSSQQRRIAGL
jgi:hypothetical protein